MVKQVETPKPKRPTLSDALAQQHELLMAFATKSARQGAQSVSFSERHNGPDNGTLFVKVDLVQHEDEEDVQFLGRIERFTQSCLDIRDRLNDLQATKRDGGGES